MAVSNFTVKFSGTVAYTDGSHGSFESTAIWQGELGGVTATHNTTASQTHLSQLYADKLTDVNAMLSALGGTISMSPSTATPDKTVDTFVAEVSGLVSYDDGTPNGLFLVQWVNGSLDLFPDDSSTHWLALVADADANAFLVTAFEVLTGASHVSISV